MKKRPARLLKVPLFAFVICCTGLLGFTFALSGSLQGKHENDIADYEQEQDQAAIRRTQDADIQDYLNSDRAEGQPKDVRMIEKLRDKETREQQEWERSHGKYRRLDS